MARHDADLQLVRCDDAGAIHSGPPRLAAAHPVPRADHVAHRYALGDADDEVELGIDGFLDRGSGVRRRYPDDRDARPGRLLRFLDRVEDRHAFVALPAFFRRDAGDVAILSVRVFEARPRVELAGLAGDALRDDPRVLVDENAHLPALAAATTFSAASAMFAPEMIGSPESARIFLPSSTLVPS